MLGLCQHENQAKTNWSLPSFSMQCGSAKDERGRRVERVSEANVPTVVSLHMVVAMNEGNKKGTTTSDEEESFSVGSNAGRSIQPIGKGGWHVASQRIYRNLSGVTSSLMTTTTSTAEPPTRSADGGTMKTIPERSVPTSRKATGRIVPFFLTSSTYLSTAISLALPAFFLVADTT
jgi:hypothetical protein